MPFKYKVRALDDEWMKIGNAAYTAGGNPRPPPIEAVIDWVMQARHSLPAESIKSSFKAWGITNNGNGSEDGLITCMQDGKDCAAGRQILASRRAANAGDAPVLVSDGEGSSDEGDEDVCFPARKAVAGTAPVQTAVIMTMQMLVTAEVQLWAVMSERFSFFVIFW